MQGMKTLYTSEYRYTIQANELDDLTHSALRGIFQEFLNQGYSPREISQVMHAAVNDFEVVSVLGKGSKRRSED